MKRTLWSLAPALIWALLGPGASSAQIAPAAPLHYGPWGFDLSALEPGTLPGDDFFAHANGTWQAQTPIPVDRDRATLRLLMEEKTELQLQELLEDVSRQASLQPNAVEAKVGLFYKSFMDEDIVEGLGARPLSQALADIRAAKTRTEICALMGRAAYDFEYSFFGLGIEVDPKEPTRYAVFIDQQGLGLPNRDFYLDPRFALEKSAYRDYAERLLGMIGWPDSVVAASQIVNLETRIAEASWPRNQNRDIDLTYNPMSVEELQDLAPAFPWRTFLTAGGLAQAGQVIVRQKSAFPKIAAVFGDTPVETLRAWLAFTLTDGASPYLSRAFVQASFDLHDKVLSGQKEQQGRSKRGIRAVAGDFYGSSGQFGNMGWAVGQIYVKRYFDPRMKAQVEELARNLLAAYKVRLTNVEWMTAATKAEALRKLDAYVIKVGYPSRPRDYSGLAIRDDDLIGNVRRSARADWDFQVKLLSRPVDREEWILTPQTDNAYNTGPLLTLEFPAALLQAPMFDPRADSAINYGAIGAYIGHEITHGFDDQGRKLDAEGRLRNWWTPEDAKKFEDRAAVLGAQYAAYEPLPGLFVDAKTTMGENIADLGGVAVALDAYHASLRGEPAPVIDGLSGDQRFFLGWAQAWRGTLTDEANRALVKSDNHAPRNYRVNGVVRNIDAWYGAFGVESGMRLYLSPAARARIW